MKKLELPNVEIFNLHRNLQKACNVNRNNFKWNYCLQKNLKATSEVVKYIQSALPTTPVKPEEEDAEKTKAYEAALSVYNEEIKEIEKTKTELDIYCIDEKHMHEDANTVETSLFVNYLAAESCSEDDDETRGALRPHAPKPRK